MYALLAATYDHTAPARFEADLDWKDDVILLRDPAGVVQGFSTLKNLAVPVDGRVEYGIYSGDTVIDRAYWGQRVLGRAFLRYLFLRKARHPLRPLYWMLITKGFKTYLLMANNFRHHWPRYEAPTPPGVGRIRDAFARELFGADYLSERGVVRFAEPMGQLKPGVADVTEELAARYPRVAFFEAANPGWAEGDELVCLARMTWTMPLFYAVKAVRKLGPTALR